MPVPGVDKVRSGKVVLTGTLPACCGLQLVRFRLHLLTWYISSDVACVEASRMHWHLQRQNRAALQLCGHGLVSKAVLPAAYPKHSRRQMWHMQCNFMPRTGWRLSACTSCTYCLAAPYWAIACHAGAALSPLRPAGPLEGLQCTQNHARHMLKPYSWPPKGPGS